MRPIIFILVILFIIGCSSSTPIEPGEQVEIIQPQTIALQRGESESSSGVYINWGYYQLEIARDGSYASILPLRNGTLETYGYHLNALKFLETSPCSHCVWTSNAHLTMDGNVSIDISIKHPFNNPCFTGFDVRGIIMFPASQRVFDNELRAIAGIGPDETAHPWWISSSKKGDAELVNREGWTSIWNPDGWYSLYTETGYPIFGYYSGKFASGENIGNVNPYIRFHSTETRHMFEVGKTITRTYIIKPPAQGPIQACYAVYAHWAEPDVLPVNNPANDFPLDANSSMPYELEIYQDGIIDPDAPNDVQAEHIHIRMKHWGVIPVEYPGTGGWDCSQIDFVDSSVSADFELHPCGLPDEYWPVTFDAVGYKKLPDSYFPGTLPILFSIHMDGLEPLYSIPVAGREYWIMDIEFGPRDGVW